MLSRMDTHFLAAAGPEPESHLKVLGSGFRPGPNALPNLRHARGP
jgi:hypothetical protein